MEPTLGRVVIYRDFDGLDHAAIVTKLFGDGWVNLCVFEDRGVGGHPMAISSVPYDDDARPKMNSWRWPERAQ